MTVPELVASPRTRAPASTSVDPVAVWMKAGSISSPPVPAWVKSPSFLNDVAVPSLVT